MADEHDRQGDDLPELGRALRRLYQPSADVPADTDAAIRAALRLGFAESRRKRLVWAPFAAVAAAAAVVLLAIWLATLAPPSAPPQPAVARTEAADLDQNGTVDILDAFHLARRLEAGEAIDAALDFNRDGAIDSRDVDRIALRAVSLTPGAG